MTSGYSTEDTTQSGSSTQADLQGNATSPPVIVERSKATSDADEMEIVEAGETVVYSTSQKNGMLEFCLVRASCVLLYSFSW